MQVTSALLCAHTSTGLSFSIRAITQWCGVTVAEASALTGVPLLVPEATAVWTSGELMLIVRLADRVWLAPGASGPQLPTVKSSAAFAGVPLSSTSVPEAAK